jgi:FKBP-type peptidyl-prolyl cis-trans isomerase FkpA
MKKLFILFTFLIIGLSSCQKVYVSKLAVTQAAIDDQKIQDYMKANNITATKDASGLYYKVVTPGVDPKPIITSTVKLTYTTEYLNGISIGKIDGITARLNTFIGAMQIGVPKIGTGGRIILIVPSGLAYGYADHGGIPGNSIILYTIDLDGFSN